MTATVETAGPRGRRASVEPRVIWNRNAGSKVGLPTNGTDLADLRELLLRHGLLDLRVYRRYSRLELLRHFWSIAVGRRAYAPKVATYRAREVSIETRCLSCRADDFDLGRTPLVLSVRAGALRVIAPPMPPPSS